MTILIEGQNLVLREFREEDIDEFFKVVGDAEVMSLVGDNNPLSCARAQAWLNRSKMECECGNPTTYAVCLKGSGEFVGYAGFSKSHARPQELEIIYGFKKEEWRKGYGKEAAHLLKTLAINRFGLSVLWATVDPLNEASIRILRTLGMEKVEDRVDENGLPEQLFCVRNETDVQSHSPPSLQSF